VALFKRPDDFRAEAAQLQAQAARTSNVELRSLLNQVAEDYRTLAQSLEHLERLSAAIEDTVRRTPAGR